MPELRTVSREGLFQSTMCGVPSMNQRKRLFLVESWKWLRVSLPAEPVMEEGTVLGTNGTRLLVDSSTQEVRMVTPVDVGSASGAVS